MQAVSDYVILEHPQLKLTEKGIIIPDNIRMPVTQIKAVAVGAECKTVKAGDTVIPNFGACQAFDIAGLPYLITRESNIFAVLDESETKYAISGAIQHGNA